MKSLNSLGIQDLILIASNNLEAKDISQEETHAVCRLNVTAHRRATQMRLNGGQASSPLSCAQHPHLTLLSVAMLP